MQRVNADVDNVVIFEIEPYGFLFLSADLDGLQAGKFGNSVVNMRYIVARRKLAQYPDIQCLILGKALPDFILVVALKDLVVGEDFDFQVFINKAFMNGNLDGQELHIGLQFFENRAQPVKLLRVFRANISFVSCRFHFVQVPD